MSASPSSPAAPTLTAAAVAHLGARPLVLRTSPRHGCCGGHAQLPIAEVGPPRDPDRYRAVRVGEVTCYIDPALGDEVAGWTVDAVGFARWRRLQLDGAPVLHG